MGQQQGSKGKSPPNPNYGSGAGTDNSNGVYNTAAATQAAEQPQYDQGLGAGTMGATGTTAPAPVTGATGVTDPAAGATGSVTTSATATPAAYTGPQPKAQGGVGGKGNMAPTPAGTMQSQAALAGATGSTAPAGYSTSYVPPPPPVFTAAAGAGSPMSGSSLTVGDVVSQGKAAKGGTPGAPAGTLGGYNNPAGGGQQQGAQSGVAGAAGTAPGATGTTGAPAPGTFIPTPEGGWKSRAESDAAHKANYDSSPQWMKNMLSGVDSFGGTNEARAEARLKNGPDTGATTTDWQTMVKKMSGESDPWEAMRKMALIGRQSGQGTSNVRRALEGSGLDPGVAARLTTMFLSGGGDAESAAQRLGVADEYKRRGGMNMQKGTYNPADYAGKTLAGTGLKNVNSTWTEGATGTTGTPGGPTGVTGATGVPDATGATGPPGPPPPNIGGNVNVGTSQGTVQQYETLAKPLGLTGGRLAELARQYGVTPDIAAQIYQQILQQSQGSGGGGNYGGSGGGAGGDGSGGGSE